MFPKIFTVVETMNVCKRKEKGRGIFPCSLFLLASLLESQVFVRSHADKGSHNAKEMRSRLTKHYNRKKQIYVYIFDCVCLLWWTNKTLLVQFFTNVIERLRYFNTDLFIIFNCFPLKCVTFPSNNRHCVRKINFLSLKKQNNVSLRIWAIFKTWQFLFLLLW